MFGSAAQFAGSERALLDRNAEEAQLLRSVVTDKSPSRLGDAAVGIRCGSSAPSTVMRRRCPGRIVQLVGQIDVVRPDSASFDGQLCCFCMELKRFDRIAVFEV